MKIIRKVYLPFSEGFYTFRMALRNRFFSFVILKRDGQYFQPLFNPDLFNGMDF